MATFFLSKANTFLPCLLSPSSSHASSSNPTYVGKRNVITKQSAMCNDSTVSLAALGKRALCVSLITTTSLFFSLDGIGFGRDNFDANAAILEADEDDELMEKVKRDRKKRIERQGAINSAGKETAYLQDLVYKLTRVGQAIDNNDLLAAVLVLGQNTNTDWIKKVNSAFNKLSYGPDEIVEVETFNSSLASLISSVTKNDMEASKSAFVASAGALERWTSLTGITGQLKGL